MRQIRHIEQQVVDLGIDPAQIVLQRCDTLGDGGELGEQLGSILPFLLEDGDLLSSFLLIGAQAFDLDEDLPSPLIESEQRLDVTRLALLLDTFAEQIRVVSKEFDVYHSGCIPEKRAPLLPVRPQAKRPGRVSLVSR
jgi:hypothetical protein